MSLKNSIAYMTSRENKAVDTSCPILEGRSEDYQNQRDATDSLAVEVKRAIIALKQDEQRWEQMSGTSRTELAEEFTALQNR